MSDLTRDCIVKTYEWKEFMAQTTESVSALREARFSVVDDIIRDQLIFQLRAKVLGEDLPEQQSQVTTMVTVEVPKNGWHAYKASRGWKHKTTLVDTLVTFNVNQKHMLIYPYSKIVTPTFGEPVHVIENPTIGDWYQR